MTIHPTAQISSKAEIHDSVQVGAYSVIGADVKIGKNSIVGSHVIIEGGSIIGESNNIYHGAIIGTPAQDKSYDGCPSFVKIGSGNTIREYVTIHRSSLELGNTTVGDRNYIMAYVHIAHDCVVANDVTLANSVHLGGHVHVGNGVFAGGVTAFHQFVRVGERAMIGAFSCMTKDAAPYALIQGNPARLSGINIVGLKRSGMKPEKILALRKAFQHLFFKKGTLKENLLTLEGEGNAEIELLKQFIQSSKRGVVMREKSV